MAKEVFRLYYLYMKQIIAIFIIILSCITSSITHAQSIIRDTELEETIKSWAEPVIIAAGLSPKSVNIIFVQNSAINAFVAGGSNIFIYTGLISKADNPEELVGVIAHELGHISGGHLIRTRSALKNASYEAMLGTVLGIGAAVLTGDGAAASAVSSATQNSAKRRFLAHSRTHESSADQAALSFLQTANIDPKGLVTFFEKLEDQDLLPQTQQAEYVRTHPLTRNRVEAINNRATQSPLFGTGLGASKKQSFDRLKAKLIGFIQPEHVALLYSQSDESISATYARAIADYRLFKKEDAIKNVDKLLNIEPNNPYFLELKAQMLLEFGQVKESLPFYKQAINVAPKSGLIRTAYAHALIESTKDNKAILEQAITQLNRAYIEEPKSLRIQRLFGTAYGRLNQQGKASLHLAEEAMLKGQYDYAKQRIHTGLKYMNKGTPEWYKAQDILNFADKDSDKGKKENK